MTGALSRDQQILLGGAGAALVLAVVLAWRGWGSLVEKQAEAQALVDRMGNPALAALLADPGGAARARQDGLALEQLQKELEATDGAVLDAWTRATQEAAGRGQDWAQDPGKWKDRLIDVQSRLQKKSVEKRVELSPDFYLGLEAYRQINPAQDQVPGLATHLSVAERLIERLMEARQTPEQYPTVCAVRSLSGPGSAIDKTPGAKAAVPPAKRGGAVSGPERKSFRVEIRCSPEVLFAFVELLARDSWLFILNDLAVTNEQQSFPLRSDIAKRFSAASGPEGAPPGQKKEKNLLEVLAGEESLTAEISLDFVAWESPAEAAARQ